MNHDNFPMSTTFSYSHGMLSTCRTMLLLGFCLITPSVAGAEEADPVETQEMPSFSGQDPNGRDLVIHREKAVIEDPESAPKSYSVSCQALFTIDKEGYPTHVAISSCGEPFESAAQAAAEKWRFRRTKVGDAWSPYRYTAVIRFDRRAGTGVGKASPMRITKQVLPILPGHMQNRYVEGENKEIRCVARMSIDTRGVPYNVEVVEGPWDLHPIIRKALLQWRFEPRSVGGVHKPFEYTWKATYQGI